MTDQTFKLPSSFVDFRNFIRKINIRNEPQLHKNNTMRMLGYVNTIVNKLTKLYNIYVYCKKHTMCIDKNSLYAKYISCDTFDEFVCCCISDFKKNNKEHIESYDDEQQDNTEYFANEFYYKMQVIFKFNINVEYSDIKKSLKNTVNDDEVEYFCKKFDDEIDDYLESMCYYIRQLNEDMSMSALKTDMETLFDKI